MWATAAMAEPMVRQSTTTRVAINENPQKFATGERFEPRVNCDRLPMGKPKLALLGRVNEPLGLAMVQVRCGVNLLPPVEPAVLAPAEAALEVFADGARAIAKPQRLAI